MTPATRDAAWIAASHGVAAVTTLAVQLALARSLGTTVFGEVVFAQAIVLTVEATVLSRAGEVATFWIGRLWNTDFTTARAYAIWITRREGMWNCIAAAALAAGAWIAGQHLELNWILVALLGLGIPLQSGFGVSKTIFIAAGRQRQQAVLEIVYSCCLLLVTITLVNAFGLGGFIATYVGMALLKNMVFSAYARRLWPAYLPIGGALRPPPLGLSAYALVRSVSLNIAQNADVILLGLSASKDTVAVYKAARTIATLPTRIAGPMWSAIRPQLLVLLRADDFAAVRRLLLRPALLMAAAGIAALPLAWSFMDELISLLYGKSFATASGLAIVLLIGGWIMFGISGWLPFIAVITGKKQIATGLFALLGIGVLAAGIAADGSAMKLAVLTSTALTVAGVLSWLALYTRNDSLSLLRR